MAEKHSGSHLARRKVCDRGKGSVGEETTQGATGGGSLSWEFRTTKDHSFPKGCSHNFPSHFPLLGRRCPSLQPLLATKDSISCATKLTNPFITTFAEHACLPWLTLTRPQPRGAAIYRGRAFQFFSLSRSLLLSCQYAYIHLQLF